MKLWQRRTIGILTLGGSFVGVVLAFGELVSSDRPILSRLVVLAFVGLYAWGVWCGARLLEGADRAIHANRIFWAIQVPYLMSPIAGYFFAAGAVLFLTLQPSRLQFGFSCLFGSKFDMSLLQFDRPFVIGANVFALAIYLFLDYCLRQINATDDSGDTAPAP